ncbi:MAG: ABC transporter ATP-binding protein [Chloroflexi bacterium]|nr:ABC transporter ATP-binding protein [Chloroflexota bacterium]
MFIFKMIEPQIQLSAVSKTYGHGERQVAALKNISLTIQRGEFLALIGPSGCGKTTLLKIIADLLPPSAGRVGIGARSPAEARRARETALVFQAPTLMEWRDIAHNITLPLEISGAARAERAERARELLEMIRLNNFANHYPHELSAGMQQQVAIARALSYRPQILLMDEPFGALDELTRERLGDALLEIWARAKVTIVFVTHSIGEAVWLADRVAVFSPRPGRITRIVEIDLPRPRIAAARASTRYAERVNEVRRALKLNGQSEVN